LPVPDPEAVDAGPHPRRVPRPLRSRTEGHREGLGARASTLPGPAVARRPCGRRRVHRPSRTAHRGRGRTGRARRPRRLRTPQGGHMNRPAETRPAEPGFDVLELVILAAVTVAALAVCLPALVVAVPLGMAIESGGWRRWPAVAGGAALTGLVVLAGGWDAYRHTIYSSWLHLRAHHPFRPVDLLAVVPLSVAGGVLAAPILPMLI